VLKGLQTKIPLIVRILDEKKQNNDHREKDASASEDLMFDPDTEIR
jgi:hypothetical protein